MGKCVPIRDMKDTAAFSKLVEESTEPITVTKNGYDQFAVIKSKDYALMQEELASARLFRRIALAETEYATGNYSDGKEFLSEMREKYGL